MPDDVFTPEATPQSRPLGEGVSRRDGPAKVRGEAQYTADFAPDNLLHAVLVTSTIARGRIAAVDASGAESVPGVVLVMTHENAPRLATPDKSKEQQTDRKLNLLQDDGVLYAEQPVGVVVAETLEAARWAASLVRYHYEAMVPRTALDPKDAFAPRKVGAGDNAAEEKGDVDAGLAAAQRIEQDYVTPNQTHNPMEPHATLAEWDGDQLTLYTATQGLYPTQKRVATLLGIPQEKVRVICYFSGGGFGSKGPTWSHVLLAAMAAKQVGRPVKLALERTQMFGPVGHRAITRQTMRLGAGEDGKLTALSHHTLTQTSSFDEFVEPASVLSRVAYATPNLSSTHEVMHADVGTPSFMRAPGEAPGSAALESAMDEMAYALKVDPLEFRLRNYAEVEPLSDKPFSSKSLRQCYEQGAERFGWRGRPLAPRTMRDKNGLLVGWGVGTASYPARLMQAKARVQLLADGTALVEAATHDMGTGTWTIMAQAAAESLGLPLDRVRFELGDTDYPNAGISGGSTTAATTGAAIHNGAEAVLGQLAALAFADPESPLYGASNAGVEVRDGRLVRRDDPTKAAAFGDILQRAGKPSIEAEGSAKPDDAVEKQFSTHAFGAVFAEVKVDPDLGQIRATRLVGAFAAGRIMNEKTARSQYLGGMVWGVSFALQEHADVDPRSGRIINNNLAEYHIPVNADLPDLDVVFVPEVDPHVNPLGVKGIGEIGITGTAGAVVNAVWHATGVRVRELPVTLDKLLV
jgi:xanthine dehydrogenase YagR molybdenum-binding subunit